MIPPAPITKYRPPIAAGTVVERRRLIDQLESGRHCRLALIHAPAGFGKSTLAAQWSQRLGRRGRTVAWMSIDHDDNNPVWFLAHLIEAVRRVRATLGEELLGVLEEHAAEADRYVITALVNELDQGGEPLVLVVDDWHRVDDPRTLAAMEFLLDSASPLLQVVVASRTRSGLPLGRLRVQGQLVEVDATALRFDAAESEQLLVGINRLPLGPQDIEELLETTDGWVAALQLASLSLRGNAEPAQLIESLSGRHHSIGEYLAENVLDTLPPRTLAFLLRTSLPERLCAELATALTGDEMSQAMLERVERDDLFLRPLDENRAWFRYHHLFVEFLRRRLERDHPAEVRGLHRRAARWFADNNLSSEAVDHALAADDPDLAVDIVTDQAMYLVEHSRMATLLMLVDKLPWTLVADRPRLQIALAWANCLLQRREPAQAALEELGRSLGPPPDAAAPPGPHDDLRVEGRVVQACIDIYSDRIGRVDQLLGDCLDRSDELRSWVIAVAANIETFASIQRFDFAAARRRQVWAWRFHQRTRGPFAGVYGQCFAGIAALEQLDVPAARKHLVLARERGIRDAGRQSHAARLAGALLGGLLYQVGELDEAERLLDEAHDLGGESGVVDFMLAGFVVLARIKAGRGRLDLAEELLEEGAAVSRELGLRRLAAAVAEEQMALGLGAGAELPEVFESDAEPVDGIEVGIAETVLAAGLRRYLGDGSGAEADREQAVSDARTLVLRAEQHHRPLAALRARALLAAVLHTAGRSADAEVETAAALQVCARVGIVGPLVDGGPRLVELLRAMAAAVDATGESEMVPGVPAVFVRELLERRGVAEPVPTAQRVAPSVTRRGPQPESGPPTVKLTELRIPLEPATDRELEILRLLDAGRSNKEIARNLNLSTNTVKWYLKALYTKFDVTRRQECVSVARRRNLLG